MREKGFARPLVLVGVAVVTIAVVVGYLFLNQKIINKPKSNPIPASKKVFEGVPNNYLDCLNTDPKFNYLSEKESNLRCQYSVWEEKDQSKYQQCLQIGGREISLIADTFDPNNPSYAKSFCEMIFYNPNYEFPKNFEECEGEKKGGIIGGDGSTQGGVMRKKTCLASVELSTAFDKTVAQKLIDKCRTLGGDYNPNNPGCLLKFDEP